MAVHTAPLRASAHHRRDRAIITDQHGEIRTPEAIVDQAAWIKLLRKPWALVRWRRVLDTAVAWRTTRALTDLRKKAKQVVATSHHACRNRLGPLSALITACTLNRLRFCAAPIRVAALG